MAVSTDVKPTTKAAGRKGAPRPAEVRLEDMPLADRLAVYRQMLTITIPQAGELLGAKDAKAYDLARRGVLPIVTVTGKRMVSVPLLLELMSKTEGAGE